MNALELLNACAGTWRGKNELYVEPTAPADASDSTLSITPALRGNFIHIDQTWARQGKPQEGSMLIGHDPDTDVVSLYWIDTFHMGRKVMTCTGKIEPDGGINLRGSYTAPPGPDWGWRIVMHVKAGKRVDIEMFNIEPDGKQHPAVRARYAIIG